MFKKIELPCICHVEELVRSAPATLAKRNQINKKVGFGTILKNKIFYKNEFEFLGQNSNSLYLQGPKTYFILKKIKN